MTAKRSKRSVTTVDLILDSAEELLRSNGVLGLTLNAVAEKAGITKGGLLYHFPAKDELERALEERFVARLQRKTGSAKQTTCSLFLAILDEISTVETMGNKHFAALILSSSAGKPSKAIKAFFASLFEELPISHPCYPYTRLVLFAVIGMILSDLLNIRVISKTDAAEVRSAIEGILDKEFGILGVPLGDPLGGVELVD